MFVDKLIQLKSFEILTRNGSPWNNLLFVSGIVLCLKPNKSSYKRHIYIHNVKIWKMEVQMTAFCSDRLTNNSYQSTHIVYIIICWWYSQINRTQEAGILCLSVNQNVKILSYYNIKKDILNNEQTVMEYFHWPHVAILQSLRLFKTNYSYNISVWNDYPFE